MTGIWALGGYQSDFAQLTAEVVDHTLDAAGLGGSDIGAIHLAIAFGEMFAAQGHLDAMPATVRDDLWDIPATRHEAACASGSVAVLAAMADLRAGNYHCALVLGVELEKTVPGDTAAAGATFLWPAMFSDVADEYDPRYGLDDSHLRATAELNLGNARRDPVAEGRLRRFDCSQMTDALSRAQAA
jgi:acetyl-CoA C-acetyltransferase